MLAFGVTHSYITYTLPVLDTQHRKAQTQLTVTTGHRCIIYITSSVFYSGGRLNDDIVIQSLGSPGH